MLIRALLFFVGRWICQYFFTLIPNSLKILPWLKWTLSLSPTHFLKLKKLKGSVYNDCCVLHRVKGVNCITILYNTVHEDISCLTLKNIRRTFERAKAAYHEKTWQLGTVSRASNCFEGLSREFFCSTHVLLCILFPEEKPQVLKYFSNKNNLTCL